MKELWFLFIIGFVFLMAMLSMAISNVENGKLLKEHTKQIAELQQMVETLKANKE